MKHVKDKYRGKTVYFHVLAELVRAAQYRGSTTYQDIAMIIGLPASGSHMGRETGQILGEISEDEVAADRPMLSSVAVGINGKPGSGFFSLARDLGLLQAGEDEVGFWQRQREGAYQAWKRPLPTTTKTAELIDKE
ncbi:MAG: hypothetical protein A2X96_00605 [Syntrophobacterales bacterium GWC2_56_13]|nr:MAG: hypothetical protein A2X96_00605 [Syntrophobacterales bacterium GWC2_56_13]